MTQTSKDIAAYICGCIVLVAFIWCVSIFCAGCACDRSIYNEQTCGAGGTNICVIYFYPDGGAAFSALTGLDTNAWKAIATGAAAGMK